MAASCLKKSRDRQALWTECGQRTGLLSGNDAFSFSCLANVDCQKLIDKRLLTSGHLTSGRLDERPNSQGLILPAPVQATPASVCRLLRLALDLGRDRRFEQRWRFLPFARRDGLAAPTLWPERSGMPARRAVFDDDLTVGGANRQTVRREQLGENQSERHARKFSS